MEAARDGDVTQVQKLIDGGVDINSLARWSNKDRNRQVTGLWAAARNGHVKVVKILLSHPGINVNFASTKYGDTPLSVASQEGHAGVCNISMIS